MISFGKISIQTWGPVFVGHPVYLNKSFDTVERCDLNINNIEFETTWIEIKNQK